MSFATLVKPSSPLVGLAMALCTERTKERERRWRKIKINKLFCVRKMHENARRPGNRPTIGPILGIPHTEASLRGSPLSPDSPLPRIISLSLSLSFSLFQGRSTENVWVYTAVVSLKQKGTHVCTSWSHDQKVPLQDSSPSAHCP